MPALNPFRFPNPIDQAEVALTACGDDFMKARDQAADNYVHANSPRDAAYWLEVLAVFDMEGKAEA